LKDFSRALPNVQGRAALPEKEGRNETDENRDVMQLMVTWWLSRPKCILKNQLFALKYTLKTFTH